MSATQTPDTADESALAAALHTAEGAFVGYDRHDHHPFGSYAALIGLFNLSCAGLLLLARQRGRPLPERVGVGDVLLLGVATFKLSRLISRDRVTSVLRAPFAQLTGDTATSEVNERPRGRGPRRAVGELLTCEYCLGQWVAAGLSYGLVFAPRATRFVERMYAGLALADALNLAYTNATRKPS